MSDLEEELLGLAEDDPYRRKKSKSKSKAYVEESEDEDEEGEEEMDMDLDDSDDDGPSTSIPPPRAKVNTNPYPLEGKYLDEDDRERLEAMPEIQREEILAGRIEEMQKFRDSMQLDMMLGGRADDDDENRKKRKHTSVSKEATRAMTDLKKKRKAKDERVTRRAQRREQRQRDSPASDHSTEDGEISRFDSYRRSPPPSPRKVNRDKEDRQTFDVDAAPVSVGDLNNARLSRYELVEMLYKDGFDSVVTGSYVRLMAKELDPMGQPKYRINKVVAVTDQTEANGSYAIEYKGRSIMDGRGLMCAYGKVQRLYRIADVSNSDFQMGEYTRFEMTNRADGIKMPKRSELNKKHTAIKELRDRPMSNEEVDRQVHARRRANPLAQRAKNAVEISGLIQARGLALRRNDTKSVHQIDAEIMSLGGDPTTGEMLDEPVSSGQGGAIGEDYDAKIQRINDNHKRKTKEAMMAATQAAIVRRKAEEAIVRANRNNSNSPAPVVVPTVVPPASGLKKGETPQQYVARTIDLDLGDF